MFLRRFIRKRPCPTRCLSSVAQKRVLGAVAHINSGKTTTSEAMLYAAGALKRMGNVDVGDTMMDYLPAERERGITISSAAVSFNWRNHEFFLVDSPGHLDFTYEVERALKVMDGVIVLLDAVAGVQPQTETVWRQADSNNLARVVFINKMDRDGADFEKTVAGVRKSFGANPVVTQVPVFQGLNFRGVFDLLERYDDQSSSGLFLKNEFDEVVSASYSNLTPEQKDSVDGGVEELTEKIAEVDDSIMERWVNGDAICKEMMLNAIRTASINGTLVPVVCGSSLKGIGVEPLMDSVIRFLPSPLERRKIQGVSKVGDAIEVQASSETPFLAYAFKVTHDKHRGRMVHLRAFSGQLNEGRKPFLNTTKDKADSATRLVRVLADKYVDVDTIGTGDIFAAVGLKHTETGDTLVLKHAPKKSHMILDGVKAPPAVFSVALSVESRTQEKELDEALRELIEEDCSLELKEDEETEETILSGMGELHLEVVVDRLRRRFAFDIEVSKPRVAYRETISEGGTRLEVIDIKVGTSRLKASLNVSIEPAIGETVIIEGFEVEEESAIRAGLEAVLGKGPILGAPVTNRAVRVTSADAEQSDAASLRTCAVRAIHKLLDSCTPILMEPVMSVEVTVPDGKTGDIVSELSHPTKRRGMIEGIDGVNSGVSRITAVVPLEGMIGWTTRMRSLTKGRGEIMMAFSKYRAVEEAVVKRLVEKK